jgi:hypothetical protein
MLQNYINARNPQKVSKPKKFQRFCPIINPVIHKSFAEDKKDDLQLSMVVIKHLVIRQ